MNADRFVPLVLSAAIGAGCAASPRLPPAELTEVQSEIRAAEVMGAEEHPEAALYLKLAKDQLSDAKKLASENQARKARLTLDRARVDAALALALARETEAEEEAQATLDEIERMTQR